MWITAPLIWLSFAGYGYYTTVMGACLSDDQV
jgi:hypothetical protein